jgi:type I restriction enzyme S subunit
MSAAVKLPDHLDLIAAAPDGIQKLRGLILELAVRGKLVPQDPNDEPASELLKRIAKERGRLEAEGVCKKSKPVLPVGRNEKPFEAPLGWQFVRLDVLLSKIGAGSTPLGGKQVYVDEGVKFLRSQNVWNEGLKLDDVARIPPAVHEKMSGTRVQAGDLLFNITGASIGRCAIVPDAFDTGNVSQHVTIIRSLSREVLQFLHTVLISDLVQRTVMDVQVGVSREGLSIGKLAQFVIPLPPLAEQHRIVAKVDELMALCDRLEAEQADAKSAHAKLVETLLSTLTQSTDAADLAANWERLAEYFDTLFTTESSLDALKQTILQLAVMGKLVPQDPKDEPASELLKRIAKERARLEAEGVCKKSKLLPPVDGDEYYSLPYKWQWSTLDPLVRVMDSGWSPACIERPSPSNDAWGVLKTTAVQTFQYLEYENKELPGHLEPRPECEVAAGDILITRAGPKNRVAISCLVEATRPHLMISDKIIRFHLVEGGMYEKFVALCLNAGATASYLEKAKSGMAASQMNITQEKLRAAPIPICSTAEQHRIVAKVDELMALCDRLKADLAESRARQARLSATLIESALAAA